MKVVGEFLLTVYVVKKFLFTSVVNVHSRRTERKFYSDVVRRRLNRSFVLTSRFRPGVLVSIHFLAACSSVIFGKNKYFHCW